MKEGNLLLPFDEAMMVSLHHNIEDIKSGADDSLHEAWVGIMIVLLGCTLQINHLLFEELVDDFVSFSDEVLGYDGRNQLPIFDQAGYVSLCPLQEIHRPVGMTLMLQHLLTIPNESLSASNVIAVLIVVSWFNQLRLDTQ